jgi:hypothetical protein
MRFRLLLILLALFAAPAHCQTNPTGSTLPIVMKLTGMR